MCRLLMDISYIILWATEVAATRILDEIRPLSNLSTRVSSLPITLLSSLLKQFFLTVLCIPIHCYGIHPTGSNVHSKMYNSTSNSNSYRLVDTILYQQNHPSRFCICMTRHYWHKVDQKYFLQKRSI